MKQRPIVERSPVERLIAGLRHYMTNIHSAEQDLFNELAKGQSPSTCFVTCSDSRVQPSLFTQSSPGELFMVRNAGNLVPAAEHEGHSETASIEFAVDVLKVRDIVVCGHSDCGAIKAVLAGPAAREGLPAVNRWLRHAEAILPIIERTRVIDEQARLKLAIEANVLLQIENLLSLPFVQRAITQQRLALHAWIYDIGSGCVLAWDAETGAFAPLLEGDTGFTAHKHTEDCDCATPNVT